MGYLTREMISASSLRAIESKLKRVCTSRVAASNSTRLPEIVAKYSQKKPMMIFCITRKSTIETSKLLAALWTTGDPRSRPWPGPSPGQSIAVRDSELRSISSVCDAFTSVDRVQIP